MKTSEANLHEKAGDRPDYFSVRDRRRWAICSYLRGFSASQLAQKLGNKFGVWRKSVALPGKIGHDVRHQDRPIFPLADDRFCL
jgi:hypothetical protein